MKIGFDAKRAFFNQTGLGNYSRTLIGDLFNVFPEDEYYFFTPKENEKFTPVFAHGHVILPRFPNPLWRSIGIESDIRRESPDVFHGLSNELPFRIRSSGVPSVVTIHDVIFDIVKEDFPPIDRAVYRMKTKKAIKNADRIIAISQNTKKDLIERFGAEEDKIEIIYQPCDPQFHHRNLSEEEKREFRSRYQLPDHFLLYVGALMKRKNVLPMIRAWELLEDKIPLLIFGSGHRYSKLVRDYISEKNIGKWVQLRPPVPFSDLPFLYKLTDTVIYPSLYEGFGLPVLEALACGARVVTSDVSSMPEAGGSLAVYVSPDQIGSIAQGIKKSMNMPPPDKNKLSDHLACFNRVDSTQQLRQIYKEVIGN